MLKEKKVLCVGVGLGDEANHISQLGADVLGIDISKGMIGIAKQKYPRIPFKLMDMMKLDLPKRSFDLVYASLSLHYADDLAKLFKGVGAVLKKGGTLLFSIVHPVYDCKEIIEIGDDILKVIGSRKNKSSGISSAVGGYLTEKYIKVNFTKEFQIEFYHHTISSWINSLIDYGFEIERFVEPACIEEVKKVNRDFYKKYKEMSPFVIISAKKK